MADGVVVAEAPGMPRHAITVQDNRNVMVNPYLSPGEAVSVEPLREGWAVIRKPTGA